ncbi:hypothetical protein EVAR_9268_1 [Eumeta japonica]|uniref:Uncharacterized protein n=1 Tax=Eumeta variegata TaxID=151549 RepID=A0A4C1TMZ0_EUMVA|nr:hypothetical protein EVAR_9268_1 [Eumeta japonica]
MHWRGGVVIEREGMRKRKERGGKRKRAGRKRDRPAPRAPRTPPEENLITFLSRIIKLNNSYARRRRGRIEQMAESSLRTTGTDSIYDDVIRIRDSPDCPPRRIYSNMNMSELALRPARAPLDRRSTGVVLF